MIFHLGDGTDTTEIRPDLSNADDFVRHVESYRGIWLEHGHVVSKRELPGELLYKLEPPRGGSIHRIGVTLGCRREPYGINPKDDIKIYYAENQPAGWKCIYDDNVPEYMEHWSYRANAEALCRGGTQRAYVKIAITTAGSAAIQDICLRTHWRPAAARGVPRRGLRVEHGWTESGQRRVFSKTIKANPESYIVTTGKSVVNTHILLEPVRAPGLNWRRDDPPVKKPPMPDDEVLDVKLRDEFRSLLKAIDADPKTGVPAAIKCKSGWLAGGAKQAQGILKSVVTGQ
jgi:hypothetical protein